jgi:hypothetical protein
VLAALDVYATVLPADPSHLEHAESRMIEALHGNNSARAAVSTALHDLAAKRLGVPVHRLWGLDAATCPSSTFTIGIDTPERIRMKVREAEQYPILKVKLGTSNDRAILTAIRETTPKEIRVDANAGWTRKQAIRSLPMLEEFGVTVLEQPLAAEDLEGLAEVTRPLQDSGDRGRELPRGHRHSPARRQGGWRQHQARQNRAASVRPLRMIAVARAHHMMVMVGCMIESSIGNHRRRAGHAARGHL